MKTYLVKFDTQRNRVYKNWEFITTEPNKKAAVDHARELWAANGHKEHMFHCEAKPYTETFEAKDYQRFRCVDYRPVTWGR